MRRFCVLLSVTLILVALGLDSNGLTRLEKIGGADAVYYFFVADTDIMPLQEAVLHGGGAEVRRNIADAKRVKRALKNIRGEAVRFGGGRADADAVAKLLKIKIYSVEEFDGIDTYYAYTAELGNGRGSNALNIDGARINVQVAFRGGVITVGTPLILGSY